MATLRAEIHPSESPLAECQSATLALAAGISLQQFIRNHSLLPFHRAVSRKDCNVDHGDPSRPNLIDFFGTKVWRETEAWFCLDCIKEDIYKKSYAYWHRSHQLPGVHWCIKHGTQLANSPLGKNAFDDMPYLDMANQYKFSAHDSKAISANPAIQRYMYIVNSFLNSERPISVIQARYRISEQVKQYPLRICKEGRQPTLTDRVLEQIPKHWLRVQFPSINDRSEGEFFSPIDNITVGSVANQVYALALAVLFESTDDALNYWFRDIEGQRHLGQNYWNSKEIFDLYVEHNGNHSSIGKSLGIEPTYACIELNAAGLPALGRVDMHTTGRAILDFQEGMSIKKACIANGASQDEVENVLRNGILKISRAIRKIVSPKNS